MYVSRKTIDSKILLHNIYNKAVNFALCKPAVKSITVSITKIIDNLIVWYNFVKKRSYNDSLNLILKHETCTLTVVNLWLWQIFLENCENSNACKNIEKFFSWLNLPWSWSLKFFLYNDLLKLAMWFFLSLFFWIWNIRVRRQDAETLEFLSFKPNIRYSTKQ